MLAEQPDKWVEGKRHLGLDVLNRSRAVNEPDEQEETAPQTSPPDYQSDQRWPPHLHHTNIPQWREHTLMTCMGCYTVLLQFVHPGLRMRSRYLPVNIILRIGPLASSFQRAPARCAGRTQNRMDTLGEITVCLRRCVMSTSASVRALRTDTAAGSVALNAILAPCTARPPFGFDVACRRSMWDLFQPDAHTVRVDVRGQDRKNLTASVATLR